MDINPNKWQEFSENFFKNPVWICLTFSIVSASAIIVQQFKMANVNNIGEWVIPAAHIILLSSLLLLGIYVLRTGYVLIIRSIEGIAHLRMSFAGKRTKRREEEAELIRLQDCYAQLSKEAQRMLDGLARMKNGLFPSPRLTPAFMELWTADLVVPNDDFKMPISSPDYSIKAPKGKSFSVNPIYYRSLST